MSGKKICWTECCQDARHGCLISPYAALIDRIQRGAYRRLYHRPAGVPRETQPSRKDFAQATLKVALQHCGAW